MLIKKKPVARIKIDKEGHIEIEHYSDGRMAKIKRIDFGLEWPI